MGIGPPACDFPKTEMLVAEESVVWLAARHAFVMRTHNTHTDGPGHTMVMSRHTKSRVPEDAQVFFVWCDGT
jgi:hypothetical protein